VIGKSTGETTSGGIGSGGGIRSGDGIRSSDDIGSGDGIGSGEDIGSGAGSGGIGSSDGSGGIGGIGRMTTTESEAYKIEALTGSGNYRTWKFSVKMVLQAKELWEVVSGKELRPSSSSECGEIGHVQTDCPKLKSDAKFAM